MSQPPALIRRWWFWALLACAVIAAAVSGNTLAQYGGWFVRKQAPKELSALLSPYYEVYRPEGEGPFPTALLFSGCDGPRDNMELWAAEMVDLGWIAVVVDSHTPRGYDGEETWRLICTGQLLTGAERAGDVAVAIEDARALPGADPERIALLGGSHGGWSVLDFMALLGHGRLPHNLTRWPDSLERQGAAGIVGQVLLYPYCGPGSRNGRWGWTDPVPSLFILVEGDAITDEVDCEDLIERMRAEGQDIESLTLIGTTHGFDQEDKDPLSVLEFSPEATARAAEVIRGFVARIDGV